MPVNKQNLLRHELIGLSVAVADSPDQNLVGKTGTVVDETQNMVAIEEDGEVKSLQKSAVVLRVTLPDGEEVQVDGKKLVARPEDRIKKCR